MMNQNSDSVAQEARRIYQEQFCDILETTHMHRFVAIEPVSGDYFLGNTLSEAVVASREKYPDRLAHALRVGHRAAIYL
jgi:hypothetical protein